MTQTDLVRALRMAEQSRKRRLQKIAAMFAELPDDFDWNELETLLSKQISDNKP